MAPHENLWLPPLPAPVSFPPDLARQGDALWEAYRDAAVQANPAFVPPRDLIPDIKRVFALSRFVADSCTSSPELLADLAGCGDLRRGLGRSDYLRRVAHALRGLDSETQLGTVLRHLRRREMIRIAWRDLCGSAGLYATMAELSHLADACAMGALHWLDRHARGVYGVPTDQSGQRQPLIILAMGKLGGLELNFSSDIDLIFAFPSQGTTRRGTRVIENDEYFSRLCQKLVHVIGAKTADGFVFRVDLRLRPFGDSGPIAMHFDAMEEYYLVQGREWERYAMIKARSLTGGGEGPRLLSALQPFVYRRYLDYGVFDSLRDMKDRISQDVARRGLDADIKLGAGGIREVEFIVQTFQLLRGGRLPELRTPRLLDALSSISSQGLLPREVCRELAAAYAFLRFAEHRIQQYADQQTHRVPSDPEGQNRLAAGMNYPSWDAFHAELEAHKARVHEHFTRLLAAEGATSRATSPQDIGRVWSEGDPERAAAILEANGFAEPAATARVLMDFKKARHIRALGAEGMKLLDRLIPVLFQTASRGRQPDRAVFLALKVIEAIGRRHCYLSLLIENPSALEQLIMLCSQGGWIPELIAKHPILLDDLLNPDTLYAPPDRAELATELDLRFDRLAPEDLESQMDELRHFTQSAILRLAAADLRNILSVSEIGRRLSDLAEIVLGRVLAMAWDYLSLRHGEPPGTEAEGKGFAVVGYGKLGGREMGYTSDLDLVFLHEAKTGEQTQGPKPMDAVLFYTRVGQRIIHILSAQTSAGSLYKVDMRLRPDGASGILVSSLESFFAYQLEQAWTWEHQALVRARAIAGDPRLCSRFEALRRDVLCKRRDPEALREAVQKMRDAILHHLWKKVPGRFLLKYAPGGVTDIEFLVQYLVLAHAHGHPEITKPTGCVAILKAAIAAGLLPEDQGEALSRIYLRYLEEIRRRGMRGEALSVPIEAVGTLPEQVLEIWQELIGHPAG